MNGNNCTSTIHVRGDESQPARSAATHLTRPYENKTLSSQRIGRFPIGSNRGILRQRARYLRRHRTEAERALWRPLRGRQLGVRFRQQVPLCGAYVDFYAADVLLVVEVDGPVHRATDARGRRQRAWDAARDARLRRLGYFVVRVSNEAVLWNLGEVIRELQSIIARRRAELAR
jgi:very-short-patch-repair endonuclease